MRWKKLAAALMYPHIAVLALLTPVSAAFLVYALTMLGTHNAAAVASYLLAFYTLCAWCLRLPRLIGFAKRVRSENRLILRWRGDVRLRMCATLYGSLVWNSAYAAFQLWLGVINSSGWFFALAGYYILLAAMRLYLAAYVRKNTPAANPRAELMRYRVCGAVLLAISLALSVIVFFMVRFDRSFRHGEITTIALAAYTFGSFAMAVVNIRKYRRYNSPVYSASKALSLAAACVSVLTLEAAMLTTFDKGELDLPQRHIMLALTGGAVSAFVVAMAVYMLIKAARSLRSAGK